MTAPIIGEGVCTECPNPVFHRKGCEPTKYCGSQCRSKSNRRTHNDYFFEYNKQRRRDIKWISQDKPLADLTFLRAHPTVTGGFNVNVGLPKRKSGDITFDSVTSYPAAVGARNYTPADSQRTKV